MDLFTNYDPQAIQDEFEKDSYEVIGCLQEHICLCRSHSIEIFSDLTTDILERVVTRRFIFSLFERDLWKNGFTSSFAIKRKLIPLILQHYQENPVKLFKTFVGQR